MTNATILVLSLLITILLLTLAFFVIRKVSNKTKNFWTLKRLSVGITVYIGVGLFALLYLSLFANSSIQVLSKSELKKIEKNIESIQKYDQEYNSSFLTDNYKKKTWEFDFLGGTLPVTINNGNEDSSFNIRHLYNDSIPAGKALVSYYQFPAIIEGIDISDKIPLPNVYMSQNQLWIEALSRHEVNYHRIKASIGILDFNREEDFDDDYPSTIFYLSSNFIVIETPSGTEIEDSQGVIQYLR
ncbi:hypothetical protein [Lysinibacillus pakistanensis]|uniref:Uncharacterized protein n=1 Tax=Lysinibacillus pakistanensis TaxID=759811 RepID=A0ABX6DDZ5_9BACI|nr:hypothetical protein GDS87_20005 [Lysinibacillus pakistanensis]